MAQEGNEFARNVYSLLKKVPKGRVTTYAALAKAAGRPGAARAVGTLMRKNAHREEIPCYRVVLSDGRTWMYSGPGGAAGKIRRLERDGIEISGGRIARLEKVAWKF